jgi:LysW-gamma-L-alpha-aminoadipyl-6-phosphate/LysW-L-glutamyl-5-phosphate reductase
MSPTEAKLEKTGGVMVSVGVIGGSGYTGGELLRLLLMHPEVENIQATSRKYLGKYLYQVHPNLRKWTSIKFSDPEDISLVDVLFLCLPHGHAQQKIDQYAQKAECIIDLSADFRIKNPEEYRRWYGQEHAAPHWLERFIYGLPELHREELRNARYVSGVGCNATATILALLPLVSAELLDLSQHTICEIKVGSSESGAEGNPGSHHPERSGVIRTFSTFRHRHTAEVVQELGVNRINLTMTSVDIVRGALAAVHGVVNPGVTSKDIWKAYRKVMGENPFIRVVKEQTGIYRVPEPKILAGTNYADLGFDLDEENCRVISICAIDNLMKGASGSAVQSMNLMLGLDETQGLSFPGLHPI